MSRSGYDYDCDDALQIGRWRGMVASATRGKRGQAFFRDLIAALEEMPEKRLITCALRRADGEVCALGALGAKRGIPLEDIDPEDADATAEVIADELNIARPLALEVMYVNDERFGDCTPEERWKLIHEWAIKNLKPATAGI